MQNCWSSKLKVFRQSIEIQPTECHMLTGWEEEEQGQQGLCLTHLAGEDL